MDIWCNWECSAVQAARSLTALDARTVRLLQGKALRVLCFVIIVIFMFGRRECLCCHGNPEENGSVVGPVSALSRGASGRGDWGKNHRNELGGREQSYKWVESATSHVHFHPPSSCVSLFPYNTHRHCLSHLTVLYISSPHHLVLFV